MNKTLYILFSLIIAGCSVIGVDNFDQDSSQAKWITASVSDSAEAANKGIRVVLCSVTPSKGFSWSNSISHPEKIIVELNKLIKALAEEKGYGYADYYSAQ